MTSPFGRFGPRKTWKWWVDAAGVDTKGAMLVSNDGDLLRNGRAIAAYINEIELRLATWADDFLAFTENGLLSTERGKELLAAEAELKRLKEERAAFTQESPARTAMLKASDELKRPRGQG